MLSELAPVISILVKRNYPFNRLIVTQNKNIFKFYVKKNLFLIEQQCVNHSNLRLQVTVMPI